MMDDYLAKCYVYLTRYKRWFNSMVCNGRYILYVWHANYELLNRERLPDDKITDRVLLLDVTHVQCALCADSGTDVTDALKKVSALKNVWSVKRLVEAVAYITELTDLRDINILVITPDGAFEHALKEYNCIKTEEIKEE